MVKKLFKHEIYSYMRVLIPTYIVLLCIALAGRLVQFLEFDVGGLYETVYELVFGSSVMLYAVAVAAAMFITFAFSIIRFYKNLFSGEGYLSFSLPVTVSEHLWVKGLTAVLVQFITLAVIALSFCIITFGDVGIEVFKAVAYIWKSGNGHSIFYFIEIIILLAIATFGGFLQYYLYIAIGQMFNKNRIIAAIGVGFVFYTASQIIATVFSVILSIVSASMSLRAMDAIASFIEKYAFECVHAGFIFGIIICAVQCLIYFLVTKVILTKKLNLE